ncbi:Z1 domain-containing protein [Variovorax robiniae]|uniref:Z1 domain-containing protein n=1 Tax=Variovorax robiniae TaxID=1836199 RepID=A0ABU8XGH3_9BURK
MTTIISQADLIAMLAGALQMMRSGPKPLGAAMFAWGQLNELNVPDAAEELFAQFSAAKPNAPLVNRLATRIHEWDAYQDVSWAAGTPPHSVARRDLIADRLGLSASEASLLNAHIPSFVRQEVSTVIANEHEPWYWKQRSRSSRFYWEAYERQLSQSGSGFSETAISKLSASIDDVVSRLSDPCRSEVYQVKGLVMGYVQSGKTAHFTGVVAKAVDVGYRLIIILAGTLNILRQQTQRRIDKSLVGQELLGMSEYGADHDWSTFVSHDGVPSAQGAPDWERLTGRNDDYAPLGARVSALAFKRQNAAKPYNDPENLETAPVRLIVIKKLPLLINNLTHDLKQLRDRGADLGHVPALVIDDESDQASINVLKPDAAGKSRRTATNGAIVDLLTALPRAQYVGYTATPFANVFIDPSDALQLFPKDFIVSLPRPEGYMGAAAFFDLDSDADEGGPNKRAHVREVSGEDRHPDNLVKAIDSFVLAGAIKLFRMGRAPLDFNFRHHTMLVHHAAVRRVHKLQAKIVEELFTSGEFIRPSGRRRLKALFESDFAVYRDSSLPFPQDYAELEPYVAKCMGRLQQDKAVRIVNGDDDYADDTPDFDAESVWAILVGGTKLSRGYTVEGLTTTYYRRLAGAGDTLMQMGRWFGFRRGYVDTVRWFVGTKEKKSAKSSKEIDIYAQFGALCQDEEAFREELTRYADEESIKPAQVPPLVHSHLPSLRPTAANKMYNAVLQYKNYGGEWKEKTTLSDECAFHNSWLTEALLAQVGAKMERLAWDQNAKGFDALCGIASPDQVLKFLREFRWEGETSPIRWELEHLGGRHGDPGIKDWVIMLPQLRENGKLDTDLWPDPTTGPLSVVRRSRVSEGGRYKVFSEPRHRDAAAWISAVKELSDPVDTLKALRCNSRAVLIIYPVLPRFDDESPVSIGFGIQFPKSPAPARATWGHRDASRKDQIVVDTT